MSQVKVGVYIFSRLRELGIKTVWGVPGDYELALLDLIGEAGIRFSGNPNELISSYAADGYGRLNGVGAWVDTFGPGELSAYCGHAGAFTEFVPVAHIVGYPGRDAMKAHKIMHHSTGTGEFDMWHNMAKYISADTCVLLDPKTAPKEIDRCLQTMLNESRPCYIGVPVDMSHLMCDASGLQRKLVLDLPPNDAEAESKVVDELRSMLETKQRPVIIIDGNATRNDAVAESQKFSTITGLPTFTTGMGKSSANEDAPNFGGVYAGAGSIEEVQKMVEGSDCVFWIGNFPSDFNTGEYTEGVKEGNMVELQRFWVKIGSKKYDVKMKHLLQALIKSIETGPLTRTSAMKITWNPYPLSPDKGTELTQDYLWAALGKWFRPGDFAIAETGTSAFGIIGSKLPAGAGLVNQTIFGSIGWATGAAVGAFQSIKETGKYKRGVLVTGEGSLHLTVQAFMDMLKLDLHPIIILLNNNGYTIERLIHGRDADYNELPQLDYAGLAKVFGPDKPSKYWGLVRTADELEQVLADAEFNDGKCFRLLEVKLGYLDAPTSVKKAAAAVEEFNKKQAL